MCHGDSLIDRALLDLGASVNLLPYSVYKTLGLRELQPTPITLQLADRSIRVPRGLVEDVIVKVDKFFFPADFLVLDMEPETHHNNQVPVILGRPFLATAKACINCQTGGMDISFGNMKVTLNIFKSARQAEDMTECYFIDDFEQIIEESLPFIVYYHPLAACLENNTSLGHPLLVESEAMMNHLDNFTLEDVHQYENLVTALPVQVEPVDPG